MPIINKSKKQYIKLRNELQSILVKIGALLWSSLTELLPLKGEEAGGP